MIITHLTLKNKKVSLIGPVRRGHVAFAGNIKLKIFGTLKCKSGKRMLLTNRIFFSTIKEALAAGYRPCGHCMREQYNQWKDGSLC